MMMKKLLIAILIAGPAALFAQSGKYTLSGSLSHVAKAKAYLRSNANGKTVIDSAEVKDGSFQFTGIVPGPVPATLMIDRQGLGAISSYKSKDQLELYLSAGHIVVTATDSVKNGTITGSKINEEYQAYNQASTEKTRQMAAINRGIRKLDSAKAALHNQYTQAFNDWKVQQKTFIKNNPDSYFSLIAVESIVDIPLDVDKIEPYFKSLSDGVRGTPLGISFGNEIEASRKTTIGAIALDFTQNDVNDKPVKLSDFRGKYVLLDFWASWCVPCRRENPYVVSAYSQYKDKNFTVLSVSLDRPGARQAWLNAIKADGLNWTNVSDLKFWDNAVVKLYGIKSVPQNFLIDPSGRIIASSLHGEALGNKLKEIFPSK